MSEPNGSMSGAPPGAPEFVTGDLACRQCGYNLRTLPVAGACPECGAAVERSLQGFLLRYASAPWMRRIARGTLLLIISTVLATLAGIAVATWMVVRTMPFFGSRPAPFDLRGYTAATTGVYLPISALAIVSIWLFTTAEPGAGASGMDSRTRVWLRYSLWLYGGSTLTGIVLTLLPTAVISTAMYGAIVAAHMPAAMAIGMFQAVLGLRYFGQLMARVPRPGLVKFARIEFWGMLVCGAMVALGQAFSIGQTAQLLTAMQTTGSLPVVTRAPVGVVTPASVPAGTSSQPVALASAPVAAPFGATLATRPPGFYAAQVLTTCGGCLMYPVGIAGFVLAIQVCRALFGAARQAEAHSAALAGHSSGGLTT